MFRYVSHKRTRLDVLPGCSDVNPINRSKMSTVIRAGKIITTELRNYTLEHDDSKDFGGYKIMRGRITKK